MKSNPQWSEVPEIVERIIAARTVTRENVQARGGTTTTISAERPFRFREFAEEVGIKYPRIYAIIRLGSEAAAKEQKSVIAWCHKHFHNLRK